MPVQRFRSFEEAREALWASPGDTTFFRRVAALWAFSERLCRPRAIPGVRRYRSIEEAQRDRETWEGRGPGA